MDTIAVFHYASLSVCALGIILNVFVILTLLRSQLTRFHSLRYSPVFKPLHYEIVALSDIVFLIAAFLQLQGVWRSVPEESFRDVWPHLFVPSNILVLATAYLFSLVYPIQVWREPRKPSTTISNWFIIPTYILSGVLIPCSLYACQHVFGYGLNPQNKQGLDEWRFTRRSLSGLGALVLSIAFVSFIILFSFEIYKRFNKSTMTSRGSFLSESLLTATILISTFTLLFLLPWLLHNDRDVIDYCRSFGREGEVGDPGRGDRIEGSRAEGESSKQTSTYVFGIDLFDSSYVVRKESADSGSALTTAPPSLHCERLLSSIAVLSLVLLASLKFFFFLLAGGVFFRAHFCGCDELSLYHLCKWGRLSTWATRLTGRDPSSRRRGQSQEFPGENIMKTTTTTKTTKTTKTTTTKSLTMTDGDVVGFAATEKNMSLSWRNSSTPTDNDIYLEQEEEENGVVVAKEKEEQEEFATTMFLPPKLGVEPSFPTTRDIVFSYALSLTSNTFRNASSPSLSQRSPEMRTKTTETTMAATPTPTPLMPSESISSENEELLRGTS